MRKRRGWREKGKEKKADDVKKRVEERGGEQEELGGAGGDWLPVLTDGVAVQFSFLRNACKDPGQDSSQLPGRHFSI